MKAQGAPKRRVASAQNEPARGRRVPHRIGVIYCLFVTRKRPMRVHNDFSAEAPIRRLRSIGSNQAKNLK